MGVPRRQPRVARYATGWACDMCRRHFPAHISRWTCLDVPSHCDICEGCAADPWFNLQTNVKLQAQVPRQPTVRGAWLGYGR